MISKKKIDLDIISELSRQTFAPAFVIVKNNEVIDFITIEGCRGANTLSLDTVNNLKSMFGKDIKIIRVKQKEKSFQKDRFNAFLEGYFNKL